MYNADGLWFEPYELMCIAAHMAIWTGPCSGEIIEWNSALQHVFAHQLSQTHNTWWIDQVHPEDQEWVDIGFHNWLRSNHPAWTSEFRFRCGNGRYRFVRAHCTRSGDSNSKDGLLTGCLQDMDVLQHHRQTLDQYQRQLHHVAQICSDEIRPPLTSLLGLLSLPIEENADDIKRIVSQLDDNLRHVISVISLPTKMEQAIGASADIVTTPQHEPVIGIIDDDRLSTFVIANLFKRAGHKGQIVTFQSGLDFLSYMINHQHQTTTLPDVITLDLFMPEVSGWAVLDELSQMMPLLTKQPRIYVISSSSDISDFERSKKYTFVDSYLVKPVSHAHCRAILDRARVKLTTLTSFGRSTTSGS